MLRTLSLLLCLFPAAAGAQLVPVIDDAPKATASMDATMFEYIAGTLHAARLAPHMKCELRVETGKELRKFLRGEEWVEFIEVHYRTNVGGGGHRMNMKFPMSVKYGLQKNVNPWSAVGEDIKIEAGDSEGHWLRFVHDGKGHLVFLSLGSDLRTLPCVVED